MSPSCRLDFLQRWLSQLENNGSLYRHYVINIKNQRFQQIYMENFKIVRHIFLKFPTLGNNAEDLAQDVFLNFFNHMEKLPEGKERPYLIVSARHAAIDFVKKNRRRKTDLDEFIDHSPSQKLWESDTSHELKVHVVGKLLDEIAAQERGGECFRMFYRDGLSLKEIAAKNGEPIGTVAARVARLRDKFKARLRSHLEFCS